MRELIPHSRKLFAVVIAAAALLSSCKREEDTNEEYGGSYLMIEGGTSVLIIDTPVNIRDSTIYFPEDMETVYGHSYLSEQEKEIYDSLVEAIGNEDESVPMQAGGEVYTKILNLIGVEQMGYGHVLDRKVGSFDVDNQRFPVVFDYRFTCEEMSNMNRAAEAVANEIMQEISPSMSQYDKLKYFHDYLITHCESDADDEYANTIYGALVRGKALCEGYAKSFSYLCNKAGIENIIVTGLTTTAHMWNMVKIEGNWYHVDVTWDKPEGTLAEMYPDMVLYQYFLVTDSVIENNHKIWTIAADPPKAYGTKENYFIKEGFYIEKEEDAEKIIESALRRTVSEGKHIASVKFSTNNQLLSIVSKMSESASGNGDFLKGAIANISSESGIKLNINWTDYYSPYRILVFEVEY